MNKPYKIISEQWKKEILLCYGWTSKEYSQFLDKLWEKDISEPTWCWETCALNDWRIVIWVKPMDHFEMLLTLNHEIFHAVDWILRKAVGITLSDDSDEVYAYTIAWLQRKIYQKILINNK